MSGRREPAPARRRRSGRARRTRRERASRRRCTGSAWDTVDERPVQAYSLGMKQRLGLAGGTAAEAPAARARRTDERAGPAGRPRGARAARRAEPGGTTVLLSSHQLAEVEALCTRVGDHQRAAGWWCRTSVATLRRPTGDVARPHPRPDWRRGVLGETVLRARRRPARRFDEPRLRDSTRRWSTPACASRSWSPSAARSRRSSSTSTEAGESRVIAVELRSWCTRPRTWISMGLLVGAAGDRSPSFVEATGIAPRARGGAGVPVPGAVERHAVRRGGRWRSSCRCSCPSPCSSWPGTRSRGRRRPARCATC